MSQMTRWVALLMKAVEGYWSSSPNACVPLGYNYSLRTRGQRITITMCTWVDCKGGQQPFDRHVQGLMLVY